MCMDMLVPVLGTNLSVYMDNLNMSVGLLNDLRVRGILAEQGTVLRRREQVRTQVPVPIMLQDYQQHMRGVDLMDQAVSYYTINHRTKKWSRLDGPGRQLLHHQPQDKEVE